MPVDGTNPRLCEICEQELPYVRSNCCEHCGLPYPSQIVQQCPDCRSTPPPWHKLVAGKARLQIQQQVIEKPQAIICIPLHKKRLRQRHYNQSYIIAKEVSDQLNIPLINPTTFIRVKQTKQQSQLDMPARKDNITGAFQLTKALNVEHIALIDDVVTTGETVKEACKLLSANGVETIDIWCVARTLAD